MAREVLLALHLALLLLSTASAAIYGRSRHHRILYTLYSSDHSDCQQNDDAPLSVDGALKLTTSAPPPDQVGYRLCSSPVVPFGELIRDHRGIQFWYLRIRVTRLSPGQKLVVVALDKQTMDSYIVNSDQHHEVTSSTKKFPAELQLRYRYARLFWSENEPTGPPVNITVSRYALFSDSLNATSRRYLCERYGNVWCQQKLDGGGGSGGVCVAPGSCSLRGDCFDSFEEPNKCPDGPFWLGGGGGNRSTQLHSGSGWGSGGGSWLSRNFPWLAFGAVPIALAFALAKICAQKRELDIDDNYDYKLSCSDHRGGDRQSDNEDESDEGGGGDSWRLEDRRQPHTASSPFADDAAPFAEPGKQQSDNQKEEKQSKQTEPPSLLPPPPPPPAAAAAVDKDEEVAPPPPPRLWDRSTHSRSRAPPDYEDNFARRSLLCQGAADAVELSAIGQKPPTSV